MNKKLFYIMSIIVLIVSCKIKDNKYGVILDSENRHKLPNGALVTINEIDKNKKIANITYESQIFMIFDFTMEEFNNKEDAKKFQEKFAPYSDKYALNKKDILPFRSEPNNYKDDNIIYRIPKNSILKVINIGEETKVGALSGKWVYALTKDGYKGYVFDYSIEIYDSIQGKIISNPLDTDTQKDIIELLKNLKHLRPYYYEKMIANKSYDIKKFKDEYGFFFVQDDIIRVGLPEVKFEYKFNKIDEVKPSGYLFRGENPKEFVLIEKDNFNNYNTTIRVNNNNFEYKFILIEQNIKDIIHHAENQNKKLIERLSSYESLLNETFGSIKFNTNKSFKWNKKEGFSELPSSGDYEIMGITPNLQMSYKSALKLRSSEGKEYFFLIDYTDNALQMILVPPIQVSDNIINDDRDKIAIILFEGSFMKNNTKQNF